jgi:hypothetical protein
MRLRGRVEHEPRAVPDDNVDREPIGPRFRHLNPRYGHSCIPVDLRHISPGASECPRGYAAIVEYLDGYRWQLLRRREVRRRASEHRGAHDRMGPE